MDSNFTTGLMQGFAQTKMQLDQRKADQEYRKIQEKLIKAQADVMMAQAKRELGQQEAMGRVQTRMAPSMGVDPRVFGSPDQQLDAGEGLVQQPAISLAEQLASAQLSPDVYAAFPELMGQQLKADMDAQRMREMMGMLSGVMGGGQYTPQPTVGPDGRVSVTYNPVAPVSREVTLPTGAKAMVWERPPALGGAVGGQQPLITDPGPMGTMLGEASTKWTNSEGMAPPAGLTPAQAEAAGYRLKTESDVERAKGQATSDVAFMQSAPGTISALEQALGNIGAVMTHPGMRLGLGALGGRVGPIAGAQADFVTRVEQIQGSAFLQAYESLKGSGQITEIEGKKAEQAVARLNRVQEPEAFKAALSELRSVIAAGLERTKKRYAAMQGGGQQPEPVAQGGAQRIRFEDLPRRAP